MSVTLPRTPSAPDSRHSNAYALPKYRWLSVSSVIRCPSIGGALKAVARSPFSSWKPSNRQSLPPRCTISPNASPVNVRDMRVHPFEYQTVCRDPSPLSPHGPDTLMGPFLAAFEIASLTSVLAPALPCSGTLDARYFTHTLNVYFAPASSGIGKLCKPCTSVLYGRM